MNHKVTWGLVGYACFGQVVLPHGLSETFNVTCRRISLSLKPYASTGGRSGDVVRVDGYGVVYGCTFDEDGANFVYCGIGVCKVAKRSDAIWVSEANRIHRVMWPDGKATKQPQSSEPRQLVSCFVCVIKRIFCLPFHAHLRYALERHHRSTQHKFKR